MSDSASTGGSATESSAKATLGDGTPRRSDPRRRLLLSVLIAAVFALFFAWDVWEGIGNLVGLRIGAARLGTDLSATGWVVLSLQLVTPVICFALALFFGRRRPLAVRAGLLMVGLCLSAALALDLQTVFGQTSLLDLG